MSISTVCLRHLRSSLGFVGIAGGAAAAPLRLSCLAVLALLGSKERPTATLAIPFRSLCIMPMTC